MTNVFESTGLTIELENNASSLATLQKTTIFNNRSQDISRKVTAYSHEIHAVGGYHSCRLSIAENKDNVFEWSNTLGQTLKVYDPQLNQIWRGVINLITLRLGSLTFTIGPLTDLANRVRVVYSPIVDSNINGGRLFTDYSDNSDSQSTYGIWVQDVSGGSLSDPDAIDQRDDYLSRFSTPKKSRSTNVGTLSAASVQIEAIGIWQTLDYPYTDLNDGTIAISTKLIDILDAHPNPGYLSTNQNYIDSNTTTTTRQELGDRTGQMIIKELLGYLGVASTRMLFGVYQDGLPVYDQQPSSIAYQFNSRDKRAVIRDEKRNEVRPWNVLPGRWLYNTDLFPGENINNDLAEDVRAEFIEIVRFTAPNLVEMNGNVFAAPSARINSRGLGGI